MSVPKKVPPKRPLFKREPVIQPAKNNERRHAVLRRQFNEAFCTADGRVSLTKLIAIAGQIVLLYHLNADFDFLVIQWDALLLVSGFVIIPDVVKMAFKLKFGNKNDNDSVQS
jgi:hypothetical protein